MWRGAPDAPQEVPLGYEGHALRTHVTWLRSAFPSSACRHLPPAGEGTQGRNARLHAQLRGGTPLAPQQRHALPRFVGARMITDRLQIPGLDDLGFVELSTGLRNLSDQGLGLR